MEHTKHQGIGKLGRECKQQSPKTTSDICNLDVLHDSLCSPLLFLCLIM